MTSREALQILVNNTKQLFFNTDYEGIMFFNIGIEGLSKTDKEAITTIEKDLEVLELIKKYEINIGEICFYLKENYVKEIILEQYNKHLADKRKINKEELEILMGWLEDDR